jgi:CBS domain-containing protein
LHLVGTATKAELEHWLVQDESTPLPRTNAPVRLTEDMRMTTAHLLFIGLRLQAACVTSAGKLIGMVSREELCKAVTED